MEYLIVGGFLFWAFIVIAFVFLTAAVWNDSLFGIGVVIIAVVVLNAVFRFDLGQYLPHTWRDWILSVLGYAAAGAVWSVYKFYVVYRDAVSELSEQCKNAGRSGDERRRYIEQNSPRVSSMKSRIIAWIAYWPISIVIYFLSDLLRHVAEYIYEWFSGVYEGIAKRIRDSFIDQP